MIEVRKQFCPQNHACPSLSVCPTGALTQKGYAAPEVDAEACICCCECTYTCPVFVGSECCTDGRR